MYDDHWYLMLLLLLFMISVNMIGLNILLAVISNAYSEFLASNLLDQTRKAEHVLATVYESVVTAMQDPVASKIDKRMSRDQARHLIDRRSGIDRSTFHDLVQLVSQDREQVDMWFSLMDVSQDGFVSREEFVKFNYICTSPIVRKSDIKKAKITYRFPRLRAALEGEIDLLEWIGGDKLAREHSADLCSIHTLRNMLRYDVLYGILNFAVLAVPILHHSFPNKTDIQAQSCSTRPYPLAWKIILPIFAVDAVLTFLKEMGTQDPFNYIWPYVTIATAQPGPNSANTTGTDPTRAAKAWLPTWNHFLHIIDLIFIALLGVAIYDVCHGGTTIQYTSILSLLRIVKCLAICTNWDQFSQVHRCLMRTGPAIRPQMNMFLITYYTFAVFGMGFFAGCVTENAPEGPGDWQGEKWQGDFANAEYYYNLHFDNLYGAFVTLFMLMIQNSESPPAPA